jgi:LacI family transcriptional regulator
MLTRVSITRKQIAEAAGVSPPLVSFVLNGQAERMRVAPETAERIRAAATRLGYVGNYHARALVSGRSQTIALAGLEDGSVMRFWMPVVHGVASRARHLGFDVLHLAAHDTEPAWQRAVVCHQQQRIDGVVLLHQRTPAQRKALAHVPTVVVGVLDTSGPSVVLDAEEGIAQGVGHLVGLGHRRLGYVARTAAGRTLMPERLAAFRRLCVERQVQGMIVEVEMGPSGNRPVHELVETGRAALAGQDLSGASAWLCYNDTLAVAVCAHLRDQGRRVPQDVSVVGFDDFAADGAIPALTTISHMLPAMGASAVDALMACIDGRAGAASTCLRVRPDLIVRASTAPPPG